MDWKTDETIQALLKRGKDTGSLTYDEVNAALPEGSPGVPESDRLESILELLEQNGISIIDEADTEEREETQDILNEVLIAEVEPNPFEDADGDGRHIDDPVRMYLTQMGEIPLLTREQEIALAKKIEVTRKRFRRKVLECDYALRQVVDTLKRVHAGELPFDRTVKVSLTENLEKDQILQRMPHNLQDARTPDGAERRRLPASCSTSALQRGRRDDAPPQRSSIRRRKAVTLVEELSIRTQKVQPLMKKLEQISPRMDELEQQIEDLRGDRGAKEDRANLEKELQRPDADHARGARPACASASRSMKQRFTEYEQAKRELSGGNLRLVVSIAKKYRNRGLSLPRPDPGRQHRPDAGGRQVRVSPRLQVHAPTPPGGFARPSPGPSPTRPARSASRCT